MTLQQQLAEIGFDSSFTPEINDKFKEYKDSNLGKLSYIYRENPSTKGLVKVFTYIIWKSMSQHETLFEYPDGISKKELAELNKNNKKLAAETLKIIEAKQELAAKEAEIFYHNCIEPKFIPEYLANKKYSITGTYLRVDPQCQENIVLPFFGNKGQLVTIQKIYMDGSKEFFSGGKIQGSYTLIDGHGDVLYICEGYSTALAIHEATKAKVCSVGSAVNYDSAIENILKIHKKDFIVICADNDLHLDENKGILEAEKASKKYGLIVKTPEFKEYKGKETTDFDDLRREQGTEAVYQQVNLSDKEKMDFNMKPSVTTLGHKNGNYFLSSTRNQTVQSFSTLDKANLFKLMPMDFWRNRFGTVNNQGATVVDYDAIASELMDACHNVGVYYGTNIRGIGCYFDEGRTVIHLGDRLLVDDKPTPLRGIKSKYTYIMCEKMPDISTQMLDDVDTQEFLKYLELTTLNNPTHRHYVAGWMVCAILAGMLEWRPHVYISGKRGTGKTQLTEIVYRIISKGFYAVYTHGIQTTAVAVRQKINSNCIPVIFDEVEGDSKKTQANAVSYISLCRIASSNSEASTILGSSSQQAYEYKVAFCAWIAGIMPQLQQDSDKSRFAMIETYKDPLNQEKIAQNWHHLTKYWQTLDETWARKFASRTIRNSKLIVDNINKARHYLNKEKSVDARLSDQFATLLAASISFKHLEPISDQELEWIYDIIKFQDETIKFASNNDQEYEALKHLLSARIRDSQGIETRIQREIIKPIISDDLNIVMGEFGVIKDQDESGETGLFIRDTGDIRMHMRTLPNMEINYMIAFARIEGAKKYRKEFQNKIHNGIFIPLSKIFDITPNEMGPQF